VAAFYRESRGCQPWLYKKLFRFKCLALEKGIVTAL